MSSVSVLGSYDESKENVKRVCLESNNNIDQILHVKRLSENAILPKRGTEHAAGYDLYR